MTATFFFQTSILIVHLPWAFVVYSNTVECSPSLSTADTVPIHTSKRDIHTPHHAKHTPQHIPHLRGTRPAISGKILWLCDRYTITGRAPIRCAILLLFSSKKKNPTYRPAVSLWNLHSPSCEDEDSENWAADQTDRPLITDAKHNGQWSRRRKCKCPCPSWRRSWRSGPELETDVYSVRSAACHATCLGHLHRRKQTGSRRWRWRHVA